MVRDASLDDRVFHIHKIQKIPAFVNRNSLHPCKLRALHCAPLFPLHPGEILQGIGTGDTGHSFGLTPDLALVRRPQFALGADPERVQ